MAETVQSGLFIPPKNRQERGRNVEGNPAMSPIRLSALLGALLLAPAAYAQSDEAAELAKQTGQRPATPVSAPKPDTSDESEDEAPPAVPTAATLEDAGQKKRRKRVSELFLCTVRADGRAVGPRYSCHGAQPVPY